MKPYIIMGLIGVALCANCIRISSDQGVASPGHPQLSPSGKYLLQIVEGFDGKVYYNEFEILSAASKEVLFKSNERFRTRDTLFFLWDNEDKVWVYSGDLGTFYWVRKDDNLWGKNTYYKEGDVEAPEFLKKVRPQFHTK